MGEREFDRERYSMDSDFSAHTNFVNDLSTGSPEGLPVCDQQNFGDHCGRNTASSFVSSLFHGNFLLISSESK